MSQNDNQKDVTQNQQFSRSEGVNENKSAVTGTSDNSPKSQGQAYPNSSMPYYPQSGMPAYPKSGMSPYSQSGMPFPYGMNPHGTSHYIMSQPPKKKMSNAKFAIIFGVIVLLVAVAAIVFLLVFKKSDSKKNNAHVSDETSHVVEVDESKEQSKLPSYDKYSEYKVGSVKADGTLNMGKAQISIDGKPYPFTDSMLNIENANYVDLAVFAGVFEIGVQTDVESRTASLTINGNNYVITHDKNECLKTSADGTTSSVAINRPAILFSNGRMFVAIKGLPGIFDLKSVDWDDVGGCVKITTNSVKVP